MGASDCLQCSGLVSGSKADCCCIWHFVDLICCTARKPLQSIVVKSTVGDISACLLPKVMR